MAVAHFEGWRDKLPVVPGVAAALRPRLYSNAGVRGLRGELRWDC
jgi:hypothetical protein